MRTSPSSPGGRWVRVYQSVRTAHLERFSELEPADVLFLDTSYDFDEEQARASRVRRLPSRNALLGDLLRHDVDVLEVNEPLMVPGLRTAVTAVLAVRLRGALRRRRTLVVSYAIENADPFDHLHDQLGRRLAAYRWASRWLVRRIDRLAFGTRASQETYGPYLRGFRGAQELVAALPAPCTACPCPDTDANADAEKQQRDQQPTVVFVGAFNERKGIRLLLDAWPLLRQRRPEARLRLLGKGPLTDLVESRVATDPSMSLHHDPDRASIHCAFAEAPVAVLLSQPWRGWREQVGLPLVEALSHGCRVVTTDQTGLAGWLRDHGHEVLEPDAGPSRVAEVLDEALSRTTDRTAIRATLPPVDGRLAADAWMFARAEAPR